MKKIKPRRLISLLLIAIMVIGMIPLTPGSASADYDDGDNCYNCGDYRTIINYLNIFKNEYQSLNMTYTI